MTDEIIDLVNEYNKETGIKELKSIAHQKGLWHRAAHIWIYNSKKQILIQLRAKTKKIMPGKWDVSVAGHIRGGEKPITSALRETEEEVGLKFEEKDLNFYKIKKYPVTISKNLINNEFIYIYLLKYDGDIKTLKKQDSELDDLKFIDIDFLEKDLVENKDKYVPHEEFWIEMINEIKKTM